MSIENTSATTAGEAPKPDKKYFTVDEANRALPYVSRIMADIVEVYKQVIELRKQVEQPSLTEDNTAVEKAYEANMDRLSELVDELQAVGAELKDFEKGLLDFPSIFEGREVQLCWHQGEEAVNFWHEVDAGFAGRQSIDLLHEPA